MCKKYPAQGCNAIFTWRGQTHHVCGLGVLQDLLLCGEVSELISAWQVVEVSSEETSGEGSDNGHAIHAFDGLKGTFWHTQWKGFGKATTALSEGLMEKIRGTGSIDFTKIGKILLFTLGLYLMSALFSFIQGWIMTGVTQKVCYRLRKEISEKINRMPMKYFESRTYGEVLSRITNDVDTLGQGLNQSITTIITSVATLVGVLIMMLSISPLGLPLRSG